MAKHYLFHLKKLPIWVAFFVFNRIEVFLQTRIYLMLGSLLSDKRLGKLCWY
jgi:hypothetical protein